MRVLLCALEAPLPPLNNGQRLVVGALLRHLRERHDVRVLAYRASDQVVERGETPMRLLSHPVPTSPFPRRLSRAAAFASGILHDRPQRVDALSERLRRPLQEELERFQPDLVHVCWGMLAPLGRDLAGRATVLGLLNAWHLDIEAQADAATGLYRRLYRRLYHGVAQRVRRFEATEYRSFGRVVVVTQEDCDAIAALDPKVPLAVIPNGVDIGFYGEAVPTARDPDRIVFHGVMDYPPNINAAEFLAGQVMPRVRAARPQAKLAIVGRAPTARIRALARQPGVEVTGEVPDIRPWLQGSRVGICPMLVGTGIKNKLLEAMASGLPCVATTLSVRGLQVADGRELFVADDAEALAAHLVRLLEDDALATSIGAAGRAYVRGHHGWDRVVQSYEAVYQEVRAATPAST